MKAFRFLYKSETTGPRVERHSPQVLKLQNINHLTRCLISKANITTSSHYTAWDHYKLLQYRDDYGETEVCTGVTRESMKD
jgi:hypothetical protein